MAAVRTILSCGTVAIYVFLAGPPVLLWSILSGRPRLLYATASLGCRFGLALAGIKVRFHGLEHLAPGTVFASNHSSNVDSPVMFRALRTLFPKVSVLYKAELRKLPVLVWAFDVAGFVPLERGNKDQSWPAIERAAGMLRRGYSFFIFPEGTRSKAGELLPFKKGGFVMALKAQAPIVPVVIQGSRAAMLKGSPLIWPTTVTVTMHPAIQTAGKEPGDREEVIAQVRRVIADGLGA
jgi:1-acyl-sn-glycerol-3-phosphate acyltransferase